MKTTTRAIIRLRVREADICMSFPKPLPQSNTAMKGLVVHELQLRDRGKEAANANTA